MMKPKMPTAKVMKRGVRPRLRTQKVSMAGKSAFPTSPLAFDPAQQGGMPAGGASPFPGPAGGGPPMGAAPGDAGA